MDSVFTHTRSKQHRIPVAQVQDGVTYYYRVYNIMIYGMSMKHNNVENSEWVYHYNFNADIVL